MTKVVLKMKMQATHHLPSLRQRIDFTIVYMEFHEKTQPLWSSRKTSRFLLLFSDEIKQTLRQRCRALGYGPSSIWSWFLFSWGLEGGKNNYVTMGIQPNNIKKITLEKILIVVFPLQVCPLSLAFALTFTTVSSESSVSRTSEVNRILPPDSLQFT